MRKAQFSALHNQLCGRYKEQSNEQRSELNSPVANRVYVAVFVFLRFDVFCVQISSQLVFCYVIFFLQLFQWLIILLCLNLFLCVRDYETECSFNHAQDLVLIYCTQVTLPAFEWQ